jgi:glutamate 5-kinase
MYKRIVIKVGTKVLTDDAGGIDIDVLTHLVEQIVAFKKQNIQVVLVSSGAMNAGRSLVTISDSNPIAQKQVYAAVGQIKLMATYADVFSKHSTVCAQVLATKDDFRDKLHYFNMRTCFENLLTNNIIPIVNENDTVATTELLFTDNDELAGLVASQINAQAVIILTSVEGFLSGDPADPESKVISEIHFDHASTFQKYISPNKTDFGRGGMLTKFNIAKKLTLQGIAVHFVNGKRKNVLNELLSGAPIGTKFLPHSKSSPLKRRIAYSEGLTKGVVTVNKCAEDLLLSKTKIVSLLPVGIIKIAGDFNKGDIIEIVGEQNQKLGFGVAQYSSSMAHALIGTKKARPIIHYDHMFINS